VIGITMPCATSTGANTIAVHPGSRTSSGSLAKFTAIRRASWRFSPPASRWRYQVRRAAIVAAAPRITEIAVQNAALVLSDADTCIAVKIADVQLI